MTSETFNLSLPIVMPKFVKTSVYCVASYIIVFEFDAFAAV